MGGAVAFDFTPIVNPTGAVLHLPLGSPQLFNICKQEAMAFAGRYARHWRAWKSPRHCSRHAPFMDRFALLAAEQGSALRPADQEHRVDFSYPI